MQSKGLIGILLLTFNIRYATKTPFEGEELWPIRKPRLLAQLRLCTAHSPEALINLQEVLYEQLNDILGGLNRGGQEWAYIGVGRDDGKTSGEYSPILYRPAVWNLSAVNNVWLSETPSVPSKGWDAGAYRILTVGTFQHVITRESIVAMNTHLDDRGNTSRLESAKLIARVAGETAKRDGHPDIPVYLSGDFNSEPTMEAYQYLATQAPFLDVQPLVAKEDRYGHQNTFSGFGHGGEPAKRIDFLFVRTPQNSSALDEKNKLWQVQQYGVLENLFDDGVYLSDHRAVVADLLLY